MQSELKKNKIDMKLYSTLLLTIFAVYVPYSNGLLGGALPACLDVNVVVGGLVPVLNLIQFEATMTIIKNRVSAEAYIEIRGAIDLVHGLLETVRNILANPLSILDITNCNKVSAQVKIIADLRVKYQLEDFTITELIYGRVVVG